MSKRFYRDIKLITFCDLCGTKYRTERGSFFSKLKLCHKHRKLYYKSFYKLRLLPHIAKFSEEKMKAYKKAHLIWWHQWVEKNHEKRKAQALASYHRRKHLKRKKKPRVLH